MTMLITWKDQTYDLDPAELPMRLLGQVEEATGYNFPELIGQMCCLNANAVKAVTWVQDLVGNPGLDFATYDGPPARAVLQHLLALKNLVDGMGKVLAPELAGNGGSPGLPSTSGSVATSSTG